MGLVEMVFYFVQELFKIYVLVRFAGLFFQKDTGKKIYLLLGLSYWIVNGTLHIAMANGWVNLASTLLFYSAIVTAKYKGKLWKKLLVAFLGIALGMACEDIVWLVMNNYFAEMNSSHLGNCMSIFLLLAMEILLQRYLQLGREADISSLNCFVMLLIPVCSIVITDILVGGVFENKDRQLVGIAAIVLINLFVFYLYDMILKAYEEKLENTVLTRQVSMYENQLEILKESRRKLNGFQHDIRHHFLMISGYVKKGKYEELLDYIDQSLHYIQVEKEYVRSGNEEIDCILNYMLERAERMGTKTEVSVSVPEKRFMPELDLNILLSNLLENALEALAQCDSRKLSICIKTEKGILYISIYNTYYDIKIKDGKFMSMKRGFEEKGIGLDHVRGVVEKYHGGIDVRSEQELFKIDAVLFLSACAEETS